MFSVVYMELRFH